VVAQAHSRLSDDRRAQWLAAYSIGRVLVRRMEKTNSWNALQTRRLATTNGPVGDWQDCSDAPEPDTLEHLSVLHDRDLEVRPFADKEQGTRVNWRWTATAAELTR
jgi:aminoglycoside phosphotransferase